jgi:hypothetical protein
MVKVCHPKAMSNVAIHSRAKRDGHRSLAPERPPGQPKSLDRDHVSTPPTPLDMPQQSPFEADEEFVFVKERPLAGKRTLHYSHHRPTKRPYFTEKDRYLLSRSSLR